MVENLYVALERLLGERRDCRVFLSEFDQSITAFREQKERLQTAHRVIRGEFEVTTPNSTYVEPPKVLNIPKVASQTISQAASSVSPTIRAEYGADESKAGRAYKREHIAFNYLHLWNYDVQAMQYYLDRLIAGVNFRVVLPDYEGGYPMCYRIDPFHAYPDRLYDPNRPYDSFIEAHRAPISFIQKKYGDEVASELKAYRRGGKWKGTDLVDCIRYFDGSEFISAASFVENGNRYGVMLSKPIKNLTGKCPVVVSAKPRADGQFRGEYDQSLGKLQHQNRITSMMLDLVADMVGAPLLADHDVDITETGPGAVWRGPPGSVSRVGSNYAHPEVFTIAAQAEAASRAEASFPEGLSGVANQSIVSAAGVNSLMGQYNIEVEMQQRLEAAALKRVFELAFEIDEKYHDEKKDLIGVANGMSFAETYTPGRDIKGAYRVRVVIPGAGQDVFQRDIRMVQQHGNGFISKQTVMENLDTVDDVVSEMRKVEWEQMRGAVWAIVQMGLQQGDPRPFMIHAKAVKKSQETGQLVSYESLYQELAALFPEAVQAAPGGQEDAFTQAASVARGGVPQAATSVPGVGNPAAGAPEVSARTIAGSRGGAPLPPLDTLMVTA